MTQKITLAFMSIYILFTIINPFTMNYDSDLLNRYIEHREITDYTVEEVDYIVNNISPYINDIQKQMEISNILFFIVVILALLLLLDYIIKMTTAEILFLQEQKRRRENEL